MKRIRIIKGTNYDKANKKANAIKFGKLKGSIVNIENSAGIQGEISLFSGIIQCKKDPNASPKMKIKSNSEGKFEIYNKIYGKYTLFIEGVNCSILCQEIEISKEETEESFFVSPKLKKNQVRAVLSWSDESLNLNLFGTFNLNKEVTCYSGYLEEKCGGLSFHYSKNSNMKASAITIETLGKYDYLFFVNEAPTKNQIDERKKKKIALNSQFLNAKVFLRYYVSELDYPVAILDHFKILDKKIKDQAEKEEHVSYLYGCVNGEKTDKIKLINNFWLKNYGLSNKLNPKQAGHLFPNGNICSAYIKK